MSLIEENFGNKINKVDIAIQRIKLADLADEPLYVCYSGGKDSKVVRRLVEIAGVDHELHYSMTTVDHPSVVREILDDDKVIVEKPRYEDGKQITMWNLIQRRGMPPTQICRYCCSELKESGGVGRLCVTGVRKAEGVQRNLNGGEVKILNGKQVKKFAKRIEADIEYADTPKGGIVMNLDNDENRRIVELCYRKHKTLINPITDWTDEDVWEFSRAENIKQSDLYIENGGEYKRLGCIGCPMASIKEREKEFADYPKIKEQYIRTFDKMLKKHKDKSKHTSWVDGQHVFDWWLYRKGNDNMKIEDLLEENDFL